MISDEELDALEKVYEEFYKGLNLVNEGMLRPPLINLRLIAEIRRLKQENQRFREALEFYANHKTYNLFEAHPVGEAAAHLGKSTIHKDGGKIAREVLEGK